MHEGRFVFSQLMDQLPLAAFRRAVRKYRGEHYVKRFSCLDQFLCMAFAQLTGRESLRDIEVCLRAHQAKLFHLGIRGRVARSTLADANEKRDWRMFAELAQHLIRTALPLYANEPLASDLAEAALVLDSTTVEVCLAAFPWAQAPHAGRGGIKLHTLLDVRSSIPTVIQLTDSRSHDVHMLDRVAPERGAIYLLDRGYLDFARLYRWHCAGAFFVMRAKKNLQAKRRYSHPVEDRSQVVSDHTIVLTRDVALTKYRSLCAAFACAIPKPARVSCCSPTTSPCVPPTSAPCTASVGASRSSSAGPKENLHVLSVVLFEQTQLECALQPPPSLAAQESVGK